MRVVTWNVRGLPLRIGSARAYRRIAELLSVDLADILIMQEAFTMAAKAIAKAAGYRSIAFGAGRTFLRHLVDSGLVLASLHDLSETSRLSFGRSRCAGIDCLANKGALASRIRMPETLVDVFTLHLNRHRAAYEPPNEPRRAMFEQIAHIRRYIDDRRDAAIPAIIAGDFNFDRPDSTLYMAWTEGCRSRMSGKSRRTTTSPDSITNSFCRAVHGSCGRSAPCTGSLIVRSATMPPSSSTMISCGLLDTALLGRFAGHARGHGPGPGPGLAAACHTCGNPATTRVGVCSRKNGDTGCVSVMTKRRLACLPDCTTPLRNTTAS